ncbi:hypothetical protein C8Q78DRAFT_279778 [Trametes maxima]|nr:hypothetical protein C8Q78DRAFT_279778 [Trametes maxima]
MSETGEMHESTWLQDDAPFIHQLPPEIFVDILERCSPKQRPVPLPFRSPTLRTSWTRLRLVCKSWNEVVCTTATFWNTIDVYAHTSWLALCLHHSGQASLYITFHNASGLVAGLPSLGSHVHRVRSLICGPECTTDSAGLSRILSFVNTPLPALERLEIWLNPRSNHHGTGPARVKLFHSHLPLLHTVELWGLSVYADVPFFHGLRHVVLSGCCISLTINQFLDCLVSMQHLESLFLTGLKSSANVENDPTRFNRSPVMLPRLTRLELSDHTPSFTSGFLSHLRLSPTACVVLDGDLQGVIEEDVTETLTSLLPPSLSRAMVLPLLASGEVKYVSVGAIDEVLEIRASSTGFWDAPCSLTLTLRSDAIDFWDLSADRILADVVEILGGSPVAHLSITAHTEVSAERWGAVFAAFPAIDTLVMYGYRHSVSFWTALGAVTTDLPENAPRVSCLRLQNVIYEGLSPASSTFFHRVLGTLQTRNDNGARLKNLVIKLASSNSQEKVSPQKAYITRMRALVDMVSYLEA